MRAPLPPDPQKHLLPFVLFIVAILSGLGWHLRTTLICIFLCLSMLNTFQAFSGHYISSLKWDYFQCFFFAIVMLSVSHGKSIDADTIQRKQER